MEVGLFMTKPGKILRFQNSSRKTSKENKNNFKSSKLKIGALETDFWKKKSPFLILDFLGSLGTWILKKKYCTTITKPTIFEQLFRAKEIADPILVKLDPLEVLFIIFLE